MVPAVTEYKESALIFFIRSSIVSIGYPSLLFQADLVFKQEEMEKSEATAKTLDVGQYHKIIVTSFPVSTPQLFLAYSQKRAEEPWMIYPYEVCYILRKCVGCCYLAALRMQVVEVFLSFSKSERMV